MDNNKILALVAQACYKEPSFVKSVIDAGTEGVKAFADNQSDKSSKMAFMMSMVLDTVDNQQFGPFSRKEIVEYLEPWFRGTPWHQKQLDFVNKDC